MKKLASVLLAVLVAFSMFSFVVSAAAPTVTATADKTTVKAGDTVKVTVAISADSGLGSFVFDLKYDKDAFKVKSTYVPSEDESDDAPKPVFSMEVVNSNVAGNVRYTAANAKPATRGGTLLVVTFEALKAVESEMTITVAEATNDAGENVAATVVANSVVINDGVVEEPSTDKPEEPSTDKPEEPSTDKPEEPSDDPCADGHTWSSWNVVKTAECKKDGLKNRNCTVCGEKEEEAIPATGTCSKKWVVTKEATATEYGEKVLKCTMCGQVYETQKLALKNDSADSLDKPAIPNTDAIA